MVRLYQDIKSFLESRLDLIKTKLIGLYIKYNVNSVQEFEESYKKGEVEESVSLDDFQEMDRVVNFNAAEDLVKSRALKAIELKDKK